MPENITTEAVEAVEECPYGVVDYTIKPDVAPLLEEQLATLQRTPERIQDLKPSTFEIEQATAEHEINTFSVKGYQFENQEELLDAKARLVNFIHAREFISRLRNAGVKAFYNYAGRPGELGLSVAKNGELKYVCFVQSPYMPEWSLLRVDDYGIPVNEKARGWRTVLMRLIAAGMMTEKQAHDEFGRPYDNAVSRRYREQLWNLRNSRPVS